MRPLTGTRRCLAHTEGLSAYAGRRSGVARRKPEPPPKVNPATAPLVVPDALDTPEAIAACRAAAIAAVAAGTMDPKVGTALSAMLEHQLRAIETVDLAKRLAALENGGGEDGTP